MMGFNYDITELKRAEQRILAGQRGPMSLTSELQLAEERERRWLARDLHVAVEDNGDGFDVSILDGTSSRPRGFGVLSIQERLRHIGGRFEIQSGDRSGTRVTLVAPTGATESMERDG